MKIEDIIKGCLKKRRKAQEALYDICHSRCFGICLRYARNQDDAKDIFQESFIKVFNNLKRLKNAESLAAWVKSIVVRTAINYYHHKPQPSDYIDINEFDMPDENAEKLASDMQTKELLVHINNMPDGYRKVFNLYVIDGYKHREIAELLQISENTSKSQLYDAKIYLRKELSKVGISKSYCYG